jgi:DNA ligase-1
VKFKEEEGKKGMLTDTIDCVVMGYTRGEGKRASFGVGQLLLGIRDGDEFVTFTKLGSGTTEADLMMLQKQLKELMVPEKPNAYINVNKTYTPDVWVRPEMVLEIAGDTITKTKTHGAGYSIRFPRLVRIRTDKSPQQATTVGEIVKMGIE